MKALDLFSGLGGIALAFEREGFEHLAMVEINKDCQSVLRRHFPNAEVIDDVKKVSRETIGPEAVDIICGGSPCQGFSVAGVRKGLADERSGLWFEYLRIIAEFTPRWIVFENVPGLLSSWSPQEAPPYADEVRDFDNERDARRWANSVESHWKVEEASDFETIVASLTELGYCVAWRVFDAQYFGVPQRRQRIILVASLASGRCAEVLFEPDGREWDLEARRQKRQDIAGTISARSGGGGGLGTDFDIAGGLQVQAFGGNNTAGSIDVATACNAKGGSGRQDFESETFIIKGAAIGREPENGPQRGDYNEVHAVAFKSTVSPSRNMSVTEEISPTLEQRCSIATVAWNERKRGDGREVEIQEELASCLTGEKASRGVAGGFGVRRLTPTECERLQGLPDHWTLFRDDGFYLSDSARYKMIGNSVAVPVFQWIAKRIMEIDTREGI